MTEHGQRLIDEFQQHGQRDGWNHRTLGINLRTLRLAVAWLGIAAPLHEIDIHAIAALGNNYAGARVAQFLAGQGLLVPDTTRSLDAHRAWVDRTVATLPNSLAREVTIWIQVLRGHGRRACPPLDSATIRRYLTYILATLRCWSTHIDSLRAITADDITAALNAHDGSTRSLLTGLRSLFRALKRVRVIFRDPTRRISLAKNQRLPAPVPADQLRGLIDQARGAAAKLTVALIAVHALHPVDVGRIQPDDLNRARGRLTIHRRGGRTHIVYLDEFTLSLLGAWLRERARRWPATTNPYLLVTQITAADTRHPPIHRGVIRAMFRPLGLQPTQLRADRLLDEARTTQDPIHLIRVFGITTHTAMKYLHAARFIKDPTTP